MLTLGEAIRAERERAGMTLASVGQALGMSTSLLSQIESGKRSISEERVAKVEALLGIADGRLVSRARWERTPEPVRVEMDALAKRERDSRALARKLKEMAAGAQGKQRSALDELLASGELRRFVDAHGSNVEGPFPPGRGVPVINRVAAGYPREFTDLGYPASIADEYIQCPDITDPDAFAARVVGDSMAPEYREGEIVVFSPQLPTPSGTDCFVRLESDHQTTFKRVFLEEGGAVIRLQPVNPAYAEARVKREDIGGMYAAAYVLRRVAKP